MQAPVAVQRSSRLSLRAAAALAFLPPLLTRLVLGQAFFFTGRGKLDNFEGTVAFFTDLGIPMPAANAAFVARLEYYGGMLLAVGLLTRLTALLLSSTMAVALLTADRPLFVQALAGSDEAGLTDVTPFVYLLLLLWLVIFGPGAVSLDHLVARWVRPRGESVPAAA
jgi:putative oxidoreductase